MGLHQITITINNFLLLENTIVMAVMKVLAVGSMYINNTAIIYNI